MKLVTYKVKCHLTRDGDKVELRTTSDREVVNTENLEGRSVTELPTIAAQLGEENDRNKAIAKTTLFPNQSEAEVSIELRFLE